MDEKAEAETTHSLFQSTLLKNFEFQPQFPSSFQKATISKVSFGTDDMLNGPAAPPSPAPLLPVDPSSPLGSLRGPPGGCEEAPVPTGDAFGRVERKEKDCPQEVISDLIKHPSNIQGVSSLVGFMYLKASNKHLLDVAGQEHFKQKGCPFCAASGLLSAGAGHLKRKPSGRRSPV